MAHNLNELLSVPKADVDPLRKLNITPPYVDIRHLLCGNRSASR